MSAVGYPIVLGARERPARPFVAAMILAALCAATVSCASLPENDTRETVLPSYETFNVVSEPLELHCGSLDCHGAGGRNFRLYGWGGLRLERLAELLNPELTGEPVAQVPPEPVPLELPEASPAGAQTTEEELWMNYVSVVSLQPELSSTVLVEQRNAEKLLLVSKGRGQVHHKGLHAMEIGDATDRCVISWFLGTVDAAACGDSILLARLPAGFADF
jgi:hypothetical protein